MGAIEELQRDLLLSPADHAEVEERANAPQKARAWSLINVFHDKCWAKFLADSNGKRALVGARCGAGTA